MKKKNQNPPQNGIITKPVIFDSLVIQQIRK
jgi:hypothetical protein